MYDIFMSEKIKIKIENDIWLCWMSLYKNKLMEWFLKIESLNYFFLICNFFLFVVNGRVFVWKNNFYI